MKTFEDCLKILNSPDMIPLTVKIFKFVDAVKALPDHPVVKIVFDSSLDRNTISVKPTEASGIEVRFRDSDWWSMEIK